MIPFIFNATTTTDIYTLSLHDALPISLDWLRQRFSSVIPWLTYPYGFATPAVAAAARSEEHTSELQSHSDLVCRLLLEKKNMLENQGASGTPPCLWNTRNGNFKLAGCK